MKIDVHRLSSRPNEAYDEISKTEKFVKLKIKTPTKPVAPNKVRVVCMSDTHSLTHNIKFDIPKGDIFIHAGDFTKCGLLKEVEEFNKWIGTLPHKHKIVIAGNHELSFDNKFKHPFAKASMKSSCGFSDDMIEEATKISSIKCQLTNCVYLEDELIEVQGLKIYGTPWQPEFCGWAFNVPRGTPCLEKWNLIPEGVDILVTHTPPLGHGDLACSNIRTGCVELLTTVQKRVKPKYHVFGHIHEDFGVSTDGKIIYVNASTCDINYQPNNQPVVFDVTLPNH